MAIAHSRTIAFNNQRYSDRLINIINIMLERFLLHIATEGLNVILMKVCLLLVTHLGLLILSVNLCSNMFRQ